MSSNQIIMDSPLSDMTFRKPTQEDFDGNGDSMLCWSWWKFEIWYDLNYGFYSLKINFFIMR